MLWDLAWSPGFGLVPVAIGLATGRVPAGGGGATVIAAALIAAGRRAGLYQHGALLVSGTGLAGGRFALAAI